MCVHVEGVSVKCAGKQNAHERREALRFLHICLASVLNLRSPDDSELPGSSMDKLTSMLFGNQVPIAVCHDNVNLSGFSL